MDLSNFKLLKEDNDSYEIGHPSGKKLTVSKAGLSEKAHKAIKMYAAGSDGGTVSPTDAAPVAPSSDPIANNMSSFSNALSGLGNSLAPLVQGSNPDAKLSDAFNDAAKNTADMASAESKGPSPASAPAPAGKDTAEVGPNSQAIQQGTQAQQAAQMDPLVQQKMQTADLLQNQENQINDYMKATQQINNQTAGFYKDYNKQVDKMQTPQQITDSYKAKDDALMKAYTDNKIDPNRFYKNESTGSRIASAIGLILSGAGAGVSGGPNLAMQQLQKAVDNDIDAQKNEQGKNLNLYNMNQQALGNDLKAQAATQNQLWTGVQAKVAMATAMAQNPAVKLKGQQMINEIEQQKIQNRLQLGVMQAGQGQPGQHALNNADPSVLVPMFIKDPGQQKVAYDEIQRAQNIKKNKTEMLDLWKKAAGSGSEGESVVGAVTHLGFHSPSRNALEGLVAEQLKGLDGTAREFALKNAENSFLPARGDKGATLATKEKAFNNWLDAEASAPTIKGSSNGVIDLNKFSSTAVEAPQQKATMGGQQYIKVPGGWKKVAANP